MTLRTGIGVFGNSDDAPGDLDEVTEFPFGHNLQPHSAPEPAQQRKKGPRLVREKEPSVAWDGYSRIAPGDYLAYCKSAKWYRDGGYKRWTCLLLFHVFSESNLEHPVATIPMWLNGFEGEKPYAKRRGRYLPEWVKANGGPPQRNDRLSSRVFVRRMARVRVGDTKSPVPYSVIKEIYEWITGSGSQSVTQSRKA